LIGQGGAEIESNEPPPNEPARPKGRPGPELKAEPPLAAAAAIHPRPSIEHRSQSLTRPRHAAAQRDSDAGPIAGLGQVTAFYAKLMGHSAVWTAEIHHLVLNR